MNNRVAYSARRTKVKKTIKDYLIPIAWLIIIVIILYSVFSWDGTTDTSTDNTKTENIASSMTVKIDDADTEAYVMSEKDEKKLISSATKLLPLQKLIVKEWTATIENTSLWTLKLNKMWELEVDKTSWLKLTSSDLWIEAKKWFTIDTTFSKIKISAWSVISLSQNEALSTVYVISWSAEVSNLVWKKTLLWNLQKLTVSNQDASNKDLDLILSKDNIDEFFRNSEWYTKNNWDSFLSGSLLTSSWTESTVSTWTLSDTSIQLDDLRDEVVLSSSKVQISWKYNNDFVSSLTLDWVKAKLDTTNKTFSFWTITLTKKENDLVFKLYDTDDNVISKVVYTFYYNWPIIQEETATTTNETPKPSSNEVRNYQVDWSKFIFTAPGTSPYSTSESMVTIRWQLPASAWVAKVSVNGFTLWSFNWTTWRYHANSDSDNFKDWTNVYEVKYYWEWWKLVYTNSFVIIKKAKLIETIEQPTTITE